jgi:hypothetical protein
MNEWTDKHIDRLKGWTVREKDIKMDGEMYKRTEGQTHIDYSIQR